MMRQIQDRLNNAAQTLKKPQKVIGKQVEERPVWGIDAYTRRMIDYALTTVTDTSEGPLTESACTHFIEKKLLPAINIQPADKAHDMREALISMQASPLASPADKAACTRVMRAIAHLGQVGIPLLPPFLHSLPLSLLKSHLPALPLPFHSYPGHPLHLARKLALLRPS
ncbi:hypothetical protein Naga_101370g1, partial [Nannochloropsis gaditana]